MAVPLTSCVAMEKLSDLPLSLSPQFCEKGILINSPSLTQGCRED